MNQRAPALLAALTAVALLSSSCTASGGSGGPPGQPAGSTSPARSTQVEITTTGTRTVTVPPTQTVPGSTITVTASTPPGTVGPPPPTSEPAAVPGTCPYISAAQVMSISGQHHGPTSIVAVEPHPICTFTRSDGGWLATIRIVTAATPAEAAAAVDQHVPPATSNPANDPPGWTGGSMVTPNGVDGNPAVASVYAVAKGRTAIIAESNQAQTVKGRQMVVAIVATLGL